MRARQINAYFNQLGEGLGHIVPPQVTSVARKPLSIAFEEIAADKIVAVEPRRGAAAEDGEPAAVEAVAADGGARRDRLIAARAHAGRAAHRPRRHRRHRRLQGRRGLPPPRRRRRPRRARADRGRRRASSARTTFSALASRAGAHLAVRRAPTRSRTPASARPPTSSSWRPATARLLGAYAAGISDDLLTATLLATRAPVVVCPAMHTEMWEHPAVQDNLATLRRRGVHVVEPDVGPPGRRRRRRRAASPTRTTSWPPSSACSAPQRPRRACGCSSPPAAPASRSTPCGSSPTARRASRATPSPPRPRPAGRQGHARHHRRPARARRRRGRARSRPRPRWQQAVLARGRPGRRRRHGRRGRRLPAQGRRPTASSRRTTASPEIVLEPTPDILADLGRGKRAGQVLVGFAAETDDLRGQRRRQARGASAST